NILTRKPYFNGEEVSLVDFAYAPLFMRLSLIGLDKELLHQGQCENVLAWSEVLLAMDCVKNSVVPDFKELLFTMIRNKGTYTAQKLSI
ncbi:MAG: glutathione S-transferase domain-containing protein, partial [Gammaproteobacteria bacterium]|nr:glutathione S-transferase domain-containing protein [Gammaproteobacteria bacterium]